MINFSRNSRSIIANWWWTVDKMLLTLITLIIVIGIFLNFSASPSVANRIGVGSFHFIKRQLLFLPLAYGLMLFLSMQGLKAVRRTAIIGYLITIALMIMTLFWGKKPRGFALDQDFRLFAATVGVYQADLCGSGGMVV